MKNTCVSFVIIVLTAWLYGCSTTLSITYYTDPPGASIYSGNTNYGYAPVTLIYTVDEEAKKRGYMTIMSPTAVWASGASSYISEGIRVDLSKSLHQQYTFIRPSNFPGRLEDARFGLEVEKLRQERARHETEKLLYLLRQQQLELQERQLQLQQKQREYIRLHCRPDSMGGFYCDE